MAKHKKEEQIPASWVAEEKEPTIKLVNFTTPTNIYHQTLTSVSCERFDISLQDNFVKLSNKDSRKFLLIPLSNVGSICFE